MNLSYQKAGVRDLPLIYQLAEEIWIPSFAPLFSEIELRSLYEGMYNDELLSRWLSKEENDFYFVLIDDNPRGYYATENQHSYIKLDKLYVHPELQCRGLGQRIIDEIIRYAKAKQVSSIQLRVNRGNEGAIRFYEKHGFSIKESVDFEGPNGFLYEDYIMVKAID